MSFTAALSLFLEEYPKALNRPFAGDSVASFVRDDVPNLLEPAVDSKRYIIQGSAGQGNWARVPWVAVFDRFITESAQEGFYIVYLVKEDFSGIYLTLNQGVTTARDQYGSDAKYSLRVRADDFAARFGKTPLGFELGPIDLAVKSSSSLGAYYEAGSIFSRLYTLKDLPNDEALFRDLKNLLNAYLIISERQILPSSTAEREDDEANFEDTTKIRLHKRIERNQRLAKKVKRTKGYCCEACGFTYADRYRGLDLDYIEAHHLVPFSELSEGKIKLDPVRDFAVLCANCHRMIHRSDFVHDIAGFKANHFTLLKA